MMACYWLQSVPTPSQSECDFPATLPQSIGHMTPSQITGHQLQVIHNPPYKSRPRTPTPTHVQSKKVTYLLLGGCEFIATVPPHRQTQRIPRAGLMCHSSPLTHAESRGFSRGGGSRRAIMGVIWLIEGLWSVAILCRSENESALRGHAVPAEHSFLQKYHT